MFFPLISIITPSYNQGQYLEQTINSVLDQKYPNLEYIIIDGGSTDNSLEIIKNHEKHLKYWISEPDKGQSHAINKGFKKATGEIIAWLNSDDVYLPDSLFLIAKLFSENPNIKIVYGDVINFIQNGRSYYYKVKKFKPIDFLSRISIHQPGVFWKSTILDETGLLNEDFHYAMDYDLWVRMFFNYKSLKINQALAKFRMHEYSKTTNNPPDLYNEKRIILSRFFNSINNEIWINKMKNLKIYHNPNNIIYPLKIDQKFSLKKAFNRYVYNYAIEEYTFGDKNKALKLFRISLLNGFLKSLYFIFRLKTEK